MLGHSTLDGTLNYINLYGTNLKEDNILAKFVENPEGKEVERC
ncbi:hypothetical protein [Thermaerobacillus caldiproteolyticus]|uniref:Uncharacterized protein n=1 Tax=Thermaerobacillus caldiproteolyticus TaxID=247480 RepID=A0A7W0C175_9BACL|nr:hypothetical protein [Anoxybacillus caldiproteolyticus]MBA2876864.1 hypothetical protein [Anoxybacillus caldiproteolyticus]